MIHRLCVLLTTATLFACGPSSSGIPLPTTMNDMDEEQGPALYKSLSCANCHGEDGLMDPLNVAAGNLGSSTLSEDAVFAVLSDGRGQMPPYMSLKENERWALVAFVLGLREE